MLSILIGILIPNVGGQDCSETKIVKSGVGAGNYYLRDGNSNFCGDGCLYMKEGDPLTKSGGPFGFCMDFTDDCSCEGCTPPVVKNGNFSNCIYKNQTIFQENYPSMTTCQLNCEPAFYFNAKYFSRYNNITCKDDTWYDIKKTLLPQMMPEDLCTSIKGCIEPPNVENGKYENCSLKPEFIKEGNYYKPTTVCFLHCNTSYFLNITRYEIITCSTVGWVDKLNDMLQTNMPSVCAPAECSPITSVRENVNINCTLDGRNVSSKYYNGTTCQIYCSPWGTIRKLLVETVICKFDGESFKWKTENGQDFVKEDTYKVIDEKCSTPRCPAPPPVENGNWTCDGNLDYILGTKCVFQCTVKRSFIGVKNYTIICNEKEDWTEYNSTMEIKKFNPLDSRLRCLVMIKFKVQSTFDNSFINDFNSNRIITADFQTPISEDILGDDENMFPLTKTEIAKDGIVQFEVSKGTWYFDFHANNYFSSYTLMEVDNTMEYTIQLDLKAKMIGIVKNKFYNKTINGFYVVCAKRQEESNSYVKRKMCEAMMFSICMRESKLNFKTCDIKTIIPRDDICMNGSTSGTKLDGFEKYKEFWKEIKTSNQSGKEEGVVFTLQPKGVYDCTGGDNDANYEPERRPISLTSAEQTEIFYLNWKMMIVKLNVTDETGWEVFDYTLVYEHKESNKQTRINISSSNQELKLEVGTINIWIEKQGIIDKGKQIKIDKENATIFHEVRRILPFMLMFKDSVDNSQVLVNISYEIWKNNSFKPMRDEHDPETGFNSDIFDKRKIFKWKNNVGNYSAGEWNENYSKEFPFNITNDYLRKFTMGYIETDIYTGRWAAHVFPQQHTVQRGYFKNDIYNTKNYLPDFYFFDAHRTGLPQNASNSRLLQRSLVLSVAVYDDDCFDFCNLFSNCTFTQCQSRDLSNIEIKVICLNCTERDENQIDEFIFPRNIEFVTTENHILKQQVVAKGLYNITCRNIGPDADDYIEPIPHQRVITEENKYVPCLLHKQLHKTMNFTFDLYVAKPLAMKIALGWEIPRKEVGRDFELNLLMVNLNDDDSPILCNTVTTFSESACESDRVTSVRQSPNKGEENPNEYDCQSKPNIAYHHRKRCCPLDYNDIGKHCSKSLTSRGYGFETATVGKKFVERYNDSLIILYVVQPYHHRKSYQFKESDIEVSVHYLEEGKEKLQYIKTNIKDGDPMFNMHILKCIRIQSQRIHFFDPFNQWMQYNKIDDKDFRHVFNKYLKATAKKCHKCFEIFCYRQQNEIEWGWNSRKNQEEKKTCCCCIDHFNTYVNEKGQRLNLTCPFEKEATDRASTCKDMKLKD